MFRLENVLLVRREFERLDTLGLKDEPRTLRLTNHEPRSIHVLIVVRGSSSEAFVVRLSFTKVNLLHQNMLKILQSK